MSNANKYELEMLELINAERTALGLNPSRLNTVLNASAEDHSAWMLESNTFSHTGSGGSSAGDRMTAAEYPFEGSYAWAENIGFQSERGEPGISDDVTDVHESLMNSPGHRANLLNPNLTEIGIGIELGSYSSGNGTFDAVMVTQNFATTDADTSALWDQGVSVIEEPPVDEEEVVEPEAPEMPVPPETPQEPFIDEVPTPEPTRPEVPEMPSTEDETDMPELAMGVPSAEVPFLAGWFVDFSDVFDFRQDGDTLNFETSIDQLMEGFVDAFELAFGIEIDEMPDQIVVANVAPPETLPISEIPDFMFECV